MRCHAGAGRTARVESEFLSYRGDPGLHDGRVVTVEHDGEVARVIVGADAGRGQRLEVRFRGVESLHQHRSEGMLLYALAEMQAAPPLRRFVFVNEDEEGDDARLEVLALDFDCIAASSD